MYVRKRGEEGEGGRERERVGGRGERGRGREGGREGEREKEREKIHIILTPSLCPFLLPPSLTTTVQSLGRWPTLLHFQQT